MNKAQAKLLPITLVAVAALVAGCGGGDSGSDGTSVALVQGRAGDEYFVTVACGAREAAGSEGVDLSVDGPKNYDPIEQTSVLNAVVAKQPDVIVITPTDREVLLGPMQQAKDAGIELIEIDSFTDSDLPAARVGADGYEGGKVQADALAGLIGESGSVLMIGLTPGIQTLDDRERGFADRIKTYEGIDYLGREYSNESPEKVSAIINAALARNPDLKGVVASGLLTSEASANAVRNAGKAGEVKVIGFDATPAQVEQLREGSMSALVAQTPRAYGRIAVEQASRLAEGEEIPARTKTDWLVLTQKNIDSPKVEDALSRPDC